VRPLKATGLGFYEFLHVACFFMDLASQVPGVEVNCEDMKGEATPLYYAALAGNEKAVGKF
jgi:hypothetical protein